MTIVTSFWIRIHNLSCWLRRFGRQKIPKSWGSNPKSTLYSLLNRTTQKYHVRPQPMPCGPCPKRFGFYLLQHKAILLQPFSTTHHLLVRESQQNTRSATTYYLDANKVFYIVIYLFIHLHKEYCQLRFNWILICPTANLDRVFKTILK